MDVPSNGVSPVHITVFCMWSHAVMLLQGRQCCAPSRVTSNTAMYLRSISFLMTCLVLVVAPDGSSMEARALLDNGSSVLFVSESLAQSLGLPHVHQNVHVSGIPGSSLRSSLQSVASFQISAAHYNGRKIELTAVVHLRCLAICWSIPCCLN